jgi:hypothetical protein
MFKIMRGPKKSSARTNANPQDDEGEQNQLYNQNSDSLDSPESAASNETNPNQGSPKSVRMTANSPASSEHDSKAPPEGNGEKRKSPTSIKGLIEEGKLLFSQNWMALFDETCMSSLSNPCSNGSTTVDEPIPLKRIDEMPRDEEADSPTLGISRMMAPDKGSESNLLENCGTGDNSLPPAKSLIGDTQASNGAVAEIEVSSTDQVKVTEKLTSRPPLDPKDTLDKTRDIKRKVAPLDLLEVTSAEAAELERSISELTMRSSHGGVEHLQRLPDNRRMAYYAVGKHHRQSGRGGNRRCYFSGKLILGGAPFYAGTVQQGLRTLVVFCLPSAVGLPNRETLADLKRQQRQRQPPVPSSLNVLKMQSASSQGGVSYAMRETSNMLGKNASKASSAKRRASGFGSVADGSSIGSKSMSRFSSLDDLSLSIEGDLDPNWGLDKDLLVQVLPEADADLLKLMSDLYPEQFATLPVQVRAPSRWNLYVKFCFFSGLPIAEGEMHYKVKDEVAEAVYGEELDLSHEVMEAVNGVQSAEILQLPNLKVFRYLRKHYAQQSAKLDDRVFRRTAWERVSPEI